MAEPMTRAQCLKRDLAAAHARAERLAALADALLWEGTRIAEFGAQKRAIEAARAAVEKHGDLEPRRRRRDGAKDRILGCLFSSGCSCDALPNSNYCAKHQLPRGRKNGH